MLMRSALGRNHLTAQLARGMRLRVDVDVPFARCELLSLLGRQRGLPAYRISGGGAALSQPDHHRSALARNGRAVEMRQSDRARQPAIRDVPGDHPGFRVIGQLNLSRAARRNWRNALFPGQRKLKGVGPRRPGPGECDQAGGKDEDSPRDCGTHDRPPTVPATTKCRGSYMPISCHFKVHASSTPFIGWRKAWHKVKCAGSEGPCKGNVAWRESLLVAAAFPRADVPPLVAEPQEQIETWNKLDVACIDPRTADLPLGPVACDPRGVFRAADTRADAPLAKPCRTGAIGLHCPYRHHGEQALRRSEVLVDRSGHHPARQLPRKCRRCQGAS